MMYHPLVSRLGKPADPQGLVQDEKLRLML